MGLFPDEIRPLLRRPGSPRTFGVLVSGAGDINPLRKLANDTLGRFEQVLQTELELPIHFGNWDYREATPTVVPVSDFSRMSLNAVDRSSAVFALFRRSWGAVTAEEIERAFQRRRGGEDVEVFAFVHPDQITTQHRDLFDDIAATFGEQIVYQEYRSQVQFQARFDACLFRFLFERLTTSNPELIRGAAA
jgi:hypothetical protein